MHQEFLGNLVFLPEIYGTYPHFYYRYSIMTGIYLHIPFCAARCVYCAFYSTTMASLRHRYVNALCREMTLRPLQDSVSTVYLGGGTPSQLSPQELVLLFQGLREAYGSFGPEVEVTMECNPEDLTPEYCDALALLPVNRVSMGVQTFDNKRLRFLRRRHNGEQVGKAMRLLRSVGIHNVSIDLMFGFPSQTLAEWEADLAQAIALAPEHISAYNLTYEESTPLYAMLRRGEIEELDDELSRAMYESLIDRLVDAGYEHYEISNFALPGYHSRHNSAYWHEVPYVGLGAAAHSYDIETRSWNVANIMDYVQAVECGKLPCEIEPLDLSTRYNDLVTTALRTSEGIDLAQLRQRYGYTYYIYILRMSLPHIHRGVLSLSHGHLSLTRQGLFVSDDIMSDLMYV